MKFTTILFALASAVVVSAQTPPPAAGQYIFITSPIATTIFTAGKTNKITWKFTASAGTTPPKAVNIDLLQNFNLVASIAPDVACEAGTYSWATPATLNSSFAYTIRFTDTSTAVTPPYESYSHTFEIDGAGGKPTDSVILTSAPPSGAIPSNASSPAKPTNATNANVTSPSATAAVSSASAINSTAINSTAPANSTTSTKANGAATKSGGNCLVALGVFAAAIAML